MPVTPTYPGVYVQELPSGARAIAGVATSIAAFVGMAERGRMNVPVRIFNFADFERSFGAETKGELATQVRNFYLNGGGQAYVMRIANNPFQADVMLRNQADTGNAMLVTARDHGLLGNQLRVEIDYGTGNAEETFNLTVYRQVIKDDGSREREGEETFEGLSMNPNLGNFAESAINGNSQLITVTAEPAPGAINGVSMSGLILSNTANTARDELAGIVTGANRRLTVKVGDNPAQPVTLPDLGSFVGSGNLTDVTDGIEDEINAALTPHGVTVTVAASTGSVAGGGTGSNRIVTITSADGAVQVTPGAGGDITVALRLGIGQGGLEGSTWGTVRPAPTGFVARMGDVTDNFEEFRRFAGTDRATINSWTLTDDSGDPAHTVNPFTLPGGAVPVFTAGGSNALANAYGVLDAIAASIAGNSNGRWAAARHGPRLALSPLYGTENTGIAPAVAFVTAGFNFATNAMTNAFRNTAAYSVGQPGGAAGPSPFQDAGPTAGDDGGLAQAGDYDDAYEIIDREVDLFNLMVLPRNDTQSNADRGLLWGAASAFCQLKRAFLLVDPDDDWNDITTAEQGVNAIRTGVATRNAACYWPRLDVGGGTYVDPSGALAGVMARTDGNRGVWKAPAGLEATVRGVTGVQHQMTDPENGVINPKALNAIRLFPAGVVSWGARTLVGFNGSGNVDDKYIPVRRTMLFIEESLYRGLRFAVFEPNDEPLYAQIRLAAGSFMNGLFRQGAFAGQKATDAYFVQCDRTTTTDNDRNLGIVNVIVGFAPLKPAEFVILTVRQIAGQVQV